MRALAAFIACLALAACAGKQTGLVCTDDSQCDPSDLCLMGQCAAEGEGGPQGLNVAGDINAVPAQQAIGATVGVVPNPASVSIVDADGIGHAFAVGCNGGSASPSAGHLAANGTLSLQISIPATFGTGSISVSCSVTSPSGATQWTSFTIIVNSSSVGTGGGSGGGAAGGSGGGAAGGSGGGSGGGSAGGAAGGSGGGAAGGSGGGSSGGSGGGSAGGSGGGTGVGIGGGTVDHLFFAVVGDSRPGNIDATSSYPTAIITKIYQDIQAMNPRPQFVVSTGDYLYANTNAGTAQPQINLYQTARSAYSGVLFPSMGNHECDGYTADNCTSLTQTDNIKAFMSTLIAPLGISLPYYAIPVHATDNSWTAKLIVVACNYWGGTQQSWLTSTLGQATTYTILVRHEPAASSPAGPCQSTVEGIMASSSYDLSLVGHSHDFYASSSSKEITVGNGGAPLSSGYSGTYGYATIEKVASGWSVKNYNYSTALPVNTYTIP